VNLLFHDKSLDLRQAWSDGTLEETLNDLSDLTEPSFERGQVHEITMARSDAFSSGVSAGIEQVRQEHGAEGGHSATEPASRGLHPDPRSLGEAT
jgi:hypothetical protein